MRSSSGPNVLFKNNKFNELVKIFLAFVNLILYLAVAFLLFENPPFKLSQCNLFCFSH